MNNNNYNSSPTGGSRWGHVLGAPASYSSPPPHMVTPASPAGNVLYGSPPTALNNSQQQLPFGTYIQQQGFSGAPVYNSNTPGQGMFAFGGGGAAAGPSSPSAAGAGAGAASGFRPAGPQGRMAPSSHGRTPHQGGGTPRIVPLCALHPYMARWTVKARVSQKSDVRRWSRDGKDGVILSFDLVDAQGEEIRVTAWNEQVDQYMDVVQVGRILLVSGGGSSLKPRNPKFNTTSHAFEVTLNHSSSILPCDEADQSQGDAIPTMVFHFRKLSQLETVQAGAVIDVLGVVEAVQPMMQVSRRDGTDTQRRVIVIRDDSNRSVEVTLWDKFGSQPGDQLEAAVTAGQHPIVAVKSVRVTDFNGRSLSTLSSSSVVLEPDRQEVGPLRHWYEQQGGATAAVTPLSGGGGGSSRPDRQITFSQIDAEGLGMNQAADWVEVIGSVTNFDTDSGLTYPACTHIRNGRTCHKKLQGDVGNWFCETCGQSCQQPAWRYIIRLTAEDHTDWAHLTAFGEAGEVIMGCAAEQMADPLMSSAEFHDRVSGRLNGTYVFKLKIFQDTFFDEPRRKLSIVKATPVDVVAEAGRLLDFIHKLDAGQTIMAPPTAQQHQQVQGQGQQGPGKQGQGQQGQGEEYGQGQQGRGAGQQQWGPPPGGASRPEQWPNTPAQGLQGQGASYQQQQQGWDGSGLGGFNGGYGVQQGNQQQGWRRGLDGSAGDCTMQRGNQHAPQNQQQRQREQFNMQPFAAGWA